LGRFELPGGTERIRSERAEGNQQYACSECRVIEAAHEDQIRSN
jgi:hypothetical protein